MKRLILILLALCLLLSMLPVTAIAASSEKPTTRGSYPVPSFRAQPIWEKIARGIPLTISHKTDWRNFPEASILGVNSCIRMGVDIIEVDFHVTKDGVPVALHDDNLRRMTNADSLIYIHDITWAQAKKYSLEDGMGNKGTSYILTAEDAKVLNSLPTYVANVGTAKAGGTMPISRFDSILELVNKQAFLLMDKVASADSFAYAYVCAKEWDMLDYVVFKGNYTLDQLEPWFAEGAALWNKKYPSAPITAQEVKTSIVFEYNSNRPANIQALLDAGVHVLGIAAGVSDSNEDYIRNTLVPYCREKGIYLRCNTGNPSYMGANAKIDCEIGWAELFDIGYTGVMTDRPGPLVNYIQERYRIRPASDRIDAEHFTNFNQDTFGFTVPEDWNAGKNKVVSNLTSKDTLIYEDIEFDGTENIFTAKAAATNSKITVYLDGTDAASKLATLSFNSTSYTSAQAKIAPVTPGKHTVYLKFSGTVALDQFRFTRGLYFGFANERLARFRYQDRLYGSLNYDTGNWFPRPASLTTAVLDNTAGTLSTNVTAGGNHYIQTGTVVGDRPLHYFPQTGDHFQIRLKLSNVVPNDSATSMTIGVVYITPDREDFRYADRVVQTVTQAQLNGEYFTLTMPMNSAFVNAEEITALRLYFTNLAPASGKTGNITIDHVYIGPKAHLPQKDYLYLDFTDRDTDEMRYMTSQYGYQNFDNCPWFVRPASMRGAWYDPLASTLLARVTAGGNHYIQTGSSVNERPLHYTPSQGDYLQMRLRIDNGTAFDASLPLSIGIAYASDARTDFYYNPLLRKNCPASVIDSGFFTVSVPMPSFFVNEAEIQALRIYINNLAPAEGEAVIEVDTFYIGPKETLPKPLHTVTFLNEDGTELAKVEVADGDSASYDGTLPVKASDKENHYTFAGWDHALNNISSDVVATAVFAAEGHNSTYSNIDTFLHKVNCTVCGYTEEMPHSYNNGLCACGAKEVVAPIYDEAVKFSHSLTLENDISINFIGLGSALIGYDSFYLECKVPVYNGNELVGYETVTIEPVYNGKNYECTLLGITAKMMNDEIEAVFHMTKDGQEYYSRTDVYSVAEYAYGKLDSVKATDTAELKAICANLLRYGSMAQVQFNYRTDALVDANMSDAHKAFLTDLNTVEMKDYRKQLSDLDTVIVPWKSTTLELGNKVIMCLIANLANYSGDPSELTMRLTFTDANGAVITEERPLALYNPEALTYAVSYDGLRATEMRSVVSAAIYRNGERVSKTVEYSIESYGARSTDTAMQNLCRAMLAYGDAANAFFAN